MKICTECGEEKEMNKFYRNRNTKDGRVQRCKECTRIHSMDFTRTKHGVITTTYQGQIRSSIKRGHNAPTYSLEEFYEWMMSKPRFHVLYDNWKRLDYQKSYRPSVDRRDDYIGYTMANIQLMTWGENKAKGHADRKNGINNKGSKAVNQLSLDGEFITTHYSMNEASRITGINLGNICSVCRKETSCITAGGFKWEYAA